MRGNPAGTLADIVMLVRYAIGESDSLEPLPSVIAGRFNLWLGREEKAGRVYTEAQKAWLAAIRDYIAVNVAIAPQDLNEAPDFTAQGGVAKAYANEGARVAITGRTKKPLEVAAKEIGDGTLAIQSNAGSVAEIEGAMQKATEMGAGVIQPVITRYTQVQKLKTDKLVANVIEAAEQCEVLSVPRVESEINLTDLVTRWQHEQGLRRLIFCDESAGSSSPTGPLRDVDGLPVGILVGPEGGWEPEEVELARAHGWSVVTLGGRTLRAETAAITVCVLMQHLFGDLK